MSALCRFCCKSRKLQGYEFFAKTRNEKQSPIRIASIALPKSPMGMIKLLAAPIRSIVRFPLFQLAFVVAVILLLQAADDKSARGQMFNGLDKLVESTVGLLSAS